MSLLGHRDGVTSPGMSPPTMGHARTHPVAYAPALRCASSGTHPVAHHSVAAQAETMHSNSPSCTTSGNTRWYMNLTPLSRPQTGALPQQRRPAKSDSAPPRGAGWEPDASQSQRRDVPCDVADMMIGEDGRTAAGRAVGRWQLGPVACRHGAGRLRAVGGMSFLACRWIGRSW
jgi:hypothetical protein